jgi:NAD(P)-dependent dehydrogenase (short-subunit alcohol dehydrogenase family)
MDDLFSVGGQVVVVSGGTRGIGFAIAAGFAERNSLVVVTGRTEEAALEAASKLREGAMMPPVGVGCDVSKADDVKRLVDVVLKTFGRVDTLVNVAGVNRRKPALEVSDEDFDYILDTNLRGAFLLSREVGKGMVARGSGCQINIASLNTDRPLKNVMPYAVSKAGIAQMTRSLAMEWGPSGVRVNAIAPGFIVTDLTRKLWSDETMQAWGNANTPLRRLGAPEDLVGAAIFLASPAASFISGQILYVDGGFTAGWAWPIPEPGAK